MTLDIWTWIVMSHRITKYTLLPENARTTCSNWWKFTNHLTLTDQHHENVTLDFDRWSEKAVTCNISNARHYKILEKKHRRYFGCLLKAINCWKDIHGNLLNILVSMTFSLLQANILQPSTITIAWNGKIQLWQGKTFCSCRDVSTRFHLYLIFCVVVLYRDWPWP